MSPGSLFLSLLLLNAIFRPYAGIVHDARLYAVQVLDHITPEAYAEDLYLKYGSQDKYSLFSLLTRPLAETVGVPAAFFLLYLGGSACWLFALSKFVRTLLSQRIAALAALLYLAVNPLPFGGFRTFHVNENFLTPRVWAVAFVILGLERLLRDKHATSLLWIAFSMALHPIMGFSGLCIWVLWPLLRRVEPRTFILLTIAGVAGIAGILLWEPLGTAICGNMDDQWREYAIGANSYCVPSQWPITDWLGIAIAFAMVATGRTFTRMKPNSQRLLDAVMVLAATGLAIGTVAPFLPYKLLIQGQAYRALWPLQLIQIPVLFGLIGGLLRGQLSAAGTGATVVVLLSFTAVMMTGWQIVAAMLVLAAVHCWRTAANEADYTRALGLRRGALLALFVSLILAITAVATTFPVVFTLCAPLARVAIVPQILGPFLAWTAAAALLVALHRLLRSRLVYRRFAVCGWLGLQTVFFLGPASSLYEFLGVREAEDVAFVEDYLTDVRLYGTSTPVLYWPLGPLESIWMRLHCNSFYSIVQISGNMFNRGTAIEGHRRAKLTREFEFSVRQQWLNRCSGARSRFTCRALGKTSNVDPPTVRKLLRLCSDEGVDLIIAPIRFDGWYAATNGHLFIYDARRIRESLANESDARFGGEQPANAAIEDYAGYRGL